MNIVAFRKNGRWVKSQEELGNYLIAMVMAGQNAAGVRRRAAQRGEGGRHRVGANRILWAFILGLVPSFP
jgi:hypothetical protein